MIFIFTKNIRDNNNHGMRASLTTLLLKKNDAVKINKLLNRWVNGVAFFERFIAYIDKNIKNIIISVDIGAHINGLRCTDRDEDQ